MDQQTARWSSSNTIQSQETRNISNKQPKRTPKAIRERRTKNPKVSRRKEVIKIRSEKDTDIENGLEDTGSGKGKLG